MPKTRTAVLALCLAVAGCEAPQMPAESRIAIVEQAANYDVTVPRSLVTLQVPKADLRPGVGEPGGATGSPRYFILKGDELIVSGWFEPARLYPGPVEASLRGEFAALVKAGFAAPTNIEKQRIGAFEAVVYDVKLPVGDAAHVRATYLDKDTWIDLHVSVSSKRSPAVLRAEVVELVRRLAVQPRS